MAKAINTIGIQLYYSTDDGSTWTELIKIKEYPDMGGAPELLETTDLTDEAQTHVLGVQSNPALEFTANYTKATYIAVKALARTEMDYKVEYGTAGADGKFTFTGQHDCWLAGAGVNAVPEIKISIAPSSVIAIDES